jgi:hypothetical protein
MSDNDNARQRARSDIDLDRRLLDENITAALNASERLHLAARKKLEGLGLVAGGVAAGTPAIGTVFTEPVLQALAKPVAKFVKTCIADAVAPLAARNAELEARLMTLEQQPTMKYQGIWDADRTYYVGDFVTNDGSVWHCDQACAGVRPPASTWTLACKRGRDAKGR